MRETLWVTVAALALTLSLPAMAGQGKGQARGKPEEKGKAAEQAEQSKARGKTEREKERKEEQERERERQAAQGRAFGKEHEKIIREWFGNSANLQGLPPGLAKRDELPPGLERHLERNGTLPPGLEKRLHSLPRDLEVKLPKTPRGVKRGVVVGNVVVIEERTSKILDIIHDVVGGGRVKEGSTGVRRTRDKY